MKCSAGQCDRQAVERGLCGAHYHRWHRHGDPLRGGPIRQIRKRGVSLEEHFRSKYVVADNGCWIWHAGCFADGYGAFCPGGGRVVKAHRWAYEQKYGPIPSLPNGKPRPLDHFFCDNRRCCNPDHVRPVTQRENVLRGNAPPAMNLAKRECLHGHPFDDANTYIAKTGNRMCRACIRERMRARRATLRKVS